VDPSNVEDIVTTTIGLLTSPDKLQRASEFCLSTAPQKTWERAGDKILAEMFDRRT
jgi:hypothetical protein